MALGSDESEEWKFRDEKKKGKKGIKSSEKAGEGGGFFSKLFGCCSSKKSSAPKKNDKGVPQPEKLRPSQSAEKKDKKK